MDSRAAGAPTQRSLPRAAVEYRSASLERSTATRGLFALIAFTGALNAFSERVFTLFADHLVDLLLTLGLTGFMIYVAWVLGPVALEEFRNGAGPVSRPLAVPWRYAVGTVFPAFLLFTFYSDALRLLGFSPRTTTVGLLALGTIVAIVALVRWSDGSDRSPAAGTAD